MKISNGLTRKELAKVTGCRPYTIDYLKSLGALPIIRGGEGSGSVALYSPEAIQLVLHHMKKRKRISE